MFCYILLLMGWAMRRVAPLGLLEIIYVTLLTSLRKVWAIRRYAPFGLLEVIYVYFLTSLRKYWAI